MSRRLGLSLLAVLALGCTDSPPPPEPSPAHVLLLTVDTLRSDHLSLHGYDRPTTPYLDRLLDGGVVFPRALAPVPRTTPAIASLFTGAYPHTTGVRTLYDTLDPEVTSLTEVLRASGYRTSAVVSNHVLVPKSGLDRGFAGYYAADDTRDAEATTRVALSVADRLASTSGPAAQQPVFLWVHYIDPHVPYWPPAGLADAFDPDYTGPYAEHFGGVPGGTGDRAYPRNLPKEQAVYQNPLSDEVNAHVRRLYAADIRATDDAIARLVEGLRNRLGNRWLVVFTADHGEALGERDDFVYDHGDYVDQGSLEVPLGFVLPPGDPRARRATLPTRVSLVDVAPTLADLLGLEQLPAGQVEGRSLAPWVLQGATSEPPDDRPVFAESGSSFYPHQIRRRQDFSIAGRFRTVVEGDWKLVWTPGHPQPWELFDLASDPHEQQDLYRDDHPAVAPLQRALRGWLRPVTHQGASPTADDLERLRALGYLP